MERIYIDNDHTVTLSALKDEDDAAVTSATVNMTLYEWDGVTEVSGVSWPVTLSHTASGTYTGSLSSSAAVVRGQRYRLKVVATDSGKTLTGWQDAYVERREL